MKQSPCTPPCLELSYSTKNIDGGHPVQEISTLVTNKTKQNKQPNLRYGFIEATIIFVNEILYVLISILTTFKNVLMQWRHGSLYCSKIKIKTQPTSY